MQYFVRTMEKHKESSGAFSIELPCHGLAAAKAEVKRLVLSANPALLQRMRVPGTRRSSKRNIDAGSMSAVSSGRACSCKVRPRVARRRGVVLALGWLLISGRSFEVSNSAMRSAGASNRSCESGEDVFMYFSAIEVTGYCTL